MKNTTIVLGNETIHTIQQMLDSKTVAELRKMASTKGLKNASKYKRDVLVSALFDIISAEYIERLEDEAKAKKVKPKKNHSKTTGSKKAPKGSNQKVNDDVAQVIEYLDGAAKGDTAEYIKDILMAYGRQVLIRVMATMKVKGWYRIYNKYTMVNKIAEYVAA